MYFHIEKTINKSRLLLQVFSIITNKLRQLAILIPVDCDRLLLNKFQLKEVFFLKKYYKPEL